MSVALDLESLEFETPELEDGRGTIDQCKYQMQTFIPLPTSVTSIPLQSLRLETILGSRCSHLLRGMGNWHYLDNGTFLPSVIPACPS